ncbi:hypothetical protein GOBAR_AA11628 [Gossypium barbadense]|uniref:SWIM-type domain-containing protein n=1 Tax=Gossypium barbadense TaxID=3634 RepID=A0A2P5Y0A4_GOSBA|nr:hypothetical protein GOBAR_AA11628 [Gossypium barbadense]
MSRIDPDAAHAAEFLEYPEILLTQRMAARFQYLVSYQKVWIAKQMAIKQLYEDFDSSYNELQGWIATMMEYVPGTQQLNQMEARHVFVKDVNDAMVANYRMVKSINVKVYSQRNKMFRVNEIIGRRHGIPPRSYGVDLQNRGCDCRRFQTLYYPCAYVVATCAKVSFNVPRTTFELIPDKGLRRNPKGRPQSSRIRNEMDIREKSDGKLYEVCRLIGHNWSKFPLRNYHIRQSSQSDRN